MADCYVFFEYRPQEEEKSNLISEDPFDLFKIDMTDFEKSISLTFQYLKILFSDLLLFILSILIDSFLIVFIKKSIKSNFHILSNSNLKMKKRCKARITAMIFLNGINVTFLRFPSALMDFYGLFFTFEISDDKLNYKPNHLAFIICRVFRVCESLQQVFYFFYIFYS